jgi:hypothetical protein
MRRDSMAQDSVFSEDVKPSKRSVDDISESFNSNSSSTGSRQPSANKKASPETKQKSVQQVAVGEINMPSLAGVSEVEGGDFVGDLAKNAKGRHAPDRRGVGAATSSGSLFDMFHWSEKDNVDEREMKERKKKLNQSPHKNKFKKKATFALDDSSLPSLSSIKDDDLASKSGFSLSERSSMSSDEWEASKKKRAIGVTFSEDTKETQANGAMTRLSEDRQEKRATGATLSEDILLDGFDQQQVDLEEDKKEKRATGVMTMLSEDRQDKRATAATLSKDILSGDVDEQQDGFNGFDQQELDFDDFDQETDGDNTALGNDGLVLDEKVDQRIREMQEKLEITSSGKGKKKKKKGNVPAEEERPSPISVVQEKDDELPSQELPSLSSLAAKPVQQRVQANNRGKKSHRMEEKKEGKVSLSVQLMNSIKKMREKGNSQKAEPSQTTGRGDSRFFPKMKKDNPKLFSSNRCLLNNEEDGVNWD